MYKNPPKEHRFKKGQSGNPKGRPKNEDIALIDLTSLFFRALLEARAKDANAQSRIKRIQAILDEE